MSNQKGIQPDFKPFYLVKDMPILQDTGADVMHFWAATDNVTNIKNAINESGTQLLLVTDWHGNHPLHYAAACSSYETARLIISTFPENQFLNQDHITPAHIAAQRGDLEMLKIMKNSKTLLNGVTLLNWTPLHFAVLYNHMDAVQFIIKNSQDIIHLLTEETDNCLLDSFQPLDFKFFSALDIAEVMNLPDMIELLKGYRALPSLHSAVTTQNFRALSYFLFSPKSRYKAMGFDLPAKFRSCNALHVAAAYDYSEICHSLLMSGATIDPIDDDGLTALDVAIIGKSQNSAKILFPFASPRVVAHAYFTAFDLKADWVFDLGEKHKFEIGLIDQNGESLLIRLMKRTIGEVSPRITEIKNTILKQSNPANKNDIIHHKDRYGATAIHYACASPATKTILQFKNSNIISQICYVKDNNGRFPLAYSILSNYDEAFNILSGIFDLQRDLHELDKFNMNAALYALFNHFGCNEKLVTREALNLICQINVKELANHIETQRTDSERTFFDYKNNKYEQVHCPLINLYCDEIRQTFDLTKCEHMKQFFAKTDGYLKNCSYLFAAILFCPNDQYFAQILNIIKNIDITYINKPDPNGLTPLMFAIMLGRDSFVEQLINMNADITKRDNKNNTIWHYVDTEAVFEAIISSSEKAMQITPDDVNIYKQNPLHIACKNNNKKALWSFVSIISDPSLLTQPDENNLTPLDYSLMSNSNKCIEYLHSQGVENRLISAIKNNCSIEEIQRYIQHGYPVNSSDRSKNTPLHAAVEMGNVDIVKFLLANHADPVALNSNMQTPLHFAGQFNHFEIVKVLLKAKIDVTNFRLEDQPFKLADDPHIRRFLFNYWKRQDIGYRFLQFILAAQVPMMSIFIPFDVTNSAELVSPNLHKDITPVFKDLVDKILFVSKILLPMRKVNTDSAAAAENSKPFNYMASLHHLLLILTTIDSSHFRAMIPIAIRPDCFSSDEIAVYCLILYEFPFRWIQFVSRYVDSLVHFQVPEIDDSGILKNKIEKYMSKETADIEKYGIPFIKDTVRTPLKVTSVSYDQDIIAAANVVIDEISSDPSCLYSQQFQSTLKTFFGKEFEMPRYIPFENNEVIKVLVLQNPDKSAVVQFISLKDVKDFLAFPISLIHIKMLSTKDDSLLITSPIGSFRIKKKKTSLLDMALYGAIYSMLGVALSFAQETCVPFDEGESLMPHLEQSGIYQCLVVYQLLGKRAINFRLVVVKDVTKQVCFDLVRSHILESIPSGLVFLRVIPRLVNKTSDQVIMFI